jgi:hypothetical protein
VPASATNTQAVPVEKIVGVLGNVLARHESDEAGSAIDDVLRGLFGEFQRDETDRGFNGVHGRVYDIAFG